MIQCRYMNKKIAMILLLVLVAAAVYAWYYLPTADTTPEELTLEGTSWRWVATVYEDETRVEPVQAEAFRAEFTTDGDFFSTTDCNSMRGSYEASEGSLSFGPLATTLMYCEGSQEQEYGSALGSVNAYGFNESGQLVLTFESGAMIFQEVEANESE